MVERGTGFDKDMAQIMYECVPCGACTNDCVTGFDPTVYIREGRTAAVVNELLPLGVAGVLKNIEHSGNIYGRKKKSSKAGSVKTSPGGEILLYVGEVAALQTPEIGKAFISLLTKTGIHFSVLEKELPSGTFLGDLIGFIEETRLQAKTCADTINSTKTKTLVVLDPWEAATII
jgi:Fe-S oxidoreductase